MITILSAAFANSDHDAAIVNSVETGLTLISAADHPDLWGDVMAAHPSAFVPPASERTCTQNQWANALDSLGKLTPWLALLSDQDVKEKDRMYFISGGDSGRYSEGSSKMIRLAAKANIDLKAAFDVATS